jgi:hypothetical protein
MQVCPRTSEDARAHIFLPPQSDSHILPSIPMPRNPDQLLLLAISDVSDHLPERLSCQARTSVTLAPTFHRYNSPFCW